MTNADEVEPRAAVLSENEAYLSRSSLPSLAYRRCAPSNCPGDSLAQTANGRFVATSSLWGTAAFGRAVGLE
jgi:hypothetical protein